MRNGQKCLLLKNITSAILLGMLHICGFSQMPAQTNEQKIQFNQSLKLCWTYPLQSVENYNIASDNESVFIITSGGILLSIDTKSKQKNWEIDLGGQIVARPFVFKNTLTVISKIQSGSLTTSNEKENIENSGEYIVRRLDKASGLVRWQSKITIKGKTGNIDFFVHIFQDKLFAVGTSGDVFMMDFSDGKIIKSKTIGTAISGEPFFEEEKIIIGTQDKRVIFVSFEKLPSTFEIKVPSKPLAFYKDKNSLFLGDDRGQIVLLESHLNIFDKAKRKWKLRIGGAVLSITPTENNLIITSLDNFIYLVSSKSGEIIWKKRLSNRPIYKPLVVDEYIVLTTIGDSTVLIIEKKSGKTINKIAVDNNLFFTAAPEKVSAFIILSTSVGLFSFVSEDNCRYKQ